MTEQIKDNLGRILATIVYDSKGNGTIRNFNGVILGTYKKSNNTTYNAIGQVIGTGNQMTRLIK